MSRERREGEPRADRDLSARDLASAGDDQASSDQDRRSSDGDQISSDRDQRSSDLDQKAADEEFARGPDPATYALSTGLRQAATQDRARRRTNATTRRGSGISSPAIDR
jgi:hypothetical protein